MSKAKIHPLAVVETGATLGDNVIIEPFAVIKKDVILGDNVVVKSHAYIDSLTEIGEGTTIFPGASIGCKPQALSFRGEKTSIKVGRHCEIREYVTIHTSLCEGGRVEIGDHCMLMAYAHIAHNCVIGKHVILSNNATLAGHVVLEDYAVVGGMTPVHQHVRIGRYAMVGGLSRITHDVPPYTLGAGIPFKFGGLNLIGLKRHGFTLETRRELSRAFRLIYRTKLHFDDALAQCQQKLKPIPEIQRWIRFCRETKRGLIGLQGIGRSENAIEKAHAEITLTTPEKEAYGLASNGMVV